jgi:hypothetical protein
MANPWLSIPLQDYEGHMGRDHAQQLSVLSELFKRGLDICVPDSVAVLGIAGGNGLEHVNHAIVRRVVGVDINARYLDEVRRRFGTYPNLELHCVDLSEGELRIPPAALVHAALFFEHAGLGGALDNALSLVAPEGHLSVVLQLPDHQQQNVTPTASASMQTLAEGFSPVDALHFRGVLERRGFRLVHEELRPLPTGKVLWLRVFASVTNRS